MPSLRTQIIVLGILLLQNISWSQGVYERGTFVSLPAGKHINHIYQSTWNTYFAVEDGVLIYSHQEEKWLEPITASNGLIQYPALLVWQDPASLEVWIVTPDYVFIYDHGTGWIQRENLPREEAFSGRYSLGITPHRVLVTADRGVDKGHSAVFLRGSGKFERWESDSALAIDWGDVQYLNSGVGSQALTDSYITDIIEGGDFDANGFVHLDGYPRASGADVSAMVLERHGESFLGTQGLGVFFKGPSSSAWIQKPFGLLSPDVMTLHYHNDELLIGGRTGITYLNDLTPRYDEAIAHAVYDYSFVSAIETNPSTIYIAARDGVFKRAHEATRWNRLIKKEDLKSKQIYSLASGLDGNVVIATEENAFLYHDSGLYMNSLFPKNSHWTVYDVTYSQGNYYLATLFGLYVFSEEHQAFIARINSEGEVQSPQTEASIDPIYRISVADSVLWATSSRGLIWADIRSGEGDVFLSPSSPFKPRGLVVHGGSIWVGSEIGLYAFSIKKLAWRQYTSSDGLVSNFITDLAARGDYIWVGSNLGLTRITWQNLY